MTKAPHHKYDVADWKPIPADQFVKALAQIGMTPDEPTSIECEVETLNDGGRTRTVFMAPCMIPGPSQFMDEETPYLMIIHDEETNRTVCLQRQGVELAA